MCEGNSPRVGVEGKSLVVEDVAWECRVLCEGGTAGLLRAVDCRPPETWGGGKMTNSNLEGGASEGWAPDVCTLVVLLMR